METLIAALSQCGAIISKNGLIKAIQVQNKCMCILIKKSFLYNITWSVKRDVCIQVGENMFNKIGIFLKKYTETVYACWEKK